MEESSRATNQREEESLLKQPVNEVVPQRTQEMAESSRVTNTSNDNVNTLNAMLEAVVLPEMSNEECIYKVPQRIRQINPQAYTPRIIAIGPFHHPLGDGPFHHPLGDENNNLQEMEKLKFIYFNEFLKRTNLSMIDLHLKLQESQNKIRNCYAGHVRFDMKDFLDIIIVDACFIIEHFLKWFNCTNDIINLKPRLFLEIGRDLLLLENQLPFFVLEEIYNLGNMPVVGCPFNQVTMSYFEPLNSQGYENIHPKHFTDLQRTFFLPKTNYGRNNTIIPAQQLYSVSRLSEAGLEFQLRDSKCLFDLEFVNGVLYMPCFNVNDTIETDMKNLLAFEECHISDLREKYISQYIRILDSLIDTGKDVNILVDKKIIVHELGDANEVATMVNTLSKNNVSMPIFNGKFTDLCHGLNGFYENSWQKNIAILKREYFGTPWKTASTIIASLLVVFTLIQAICSILSLVLKQPQ